LYRQNEELAGRPLFPSYSYRPDLLDIFSTKDPRPFFQALLGALSLKGTYNTGVLPLGDRVVPLVEDHAASYALDADTLETLRHSGVSKIPGIGPESLTYMRQTITAHPKLDPQTGRRFLYGVIPAEAPFMGLRLNTVTDSGELEFKGFVKPSRGRFIFPKPPGTDHLAEPLKALGIELGAGFGMSYFPQPHDIAVAGDMLCVPMHPIGANMADLVSVGPADGLFWDKGSPSELVFIDHHTFEEKLRVEISPPIAAFHWPWGRVLENGQIELVTVEHEDLDAALGHGLERQLNDSQNGANIGGKLIRLSIDPKTRRVEKTVLSDSPVELPVTDRRFEGDNSNSLYCVAALDNARAMNAIQRFDITRTSGGPFQTWQAPEGHIVSEPTFVPAKESTRRGHGDAPGFLVTVVHHQDGGRPGSYVAILDAEQVDRGPVARFDLPHAVPFGLHTAFQKASLDEAR
jgi:carotenoid cleavage dioxygenase-like enzyme